MTAARDSIVDQLRTELLNRVERHPVRTWSPEMLRVFISALDLYATQRPPQEVPPGFRPHLVK